MEWISADRKLDIQIGSSHDRCIFLIIHLPSMCSQLNLSRTELIANAYATTEDYPEERPKIELEGRFGEFKQGILEVQNTYLNVPIHTFYLLPVQAFVDYGNEYAANRHKGLIDILNFFVIST